MTIKSYDLDADELVQVCDACGDEHTVDLTAVDIGVHTPDGIAHNGDITQLPVCPVCGGQEFLIRTFDAMDSKEGTQRGAVNTIHKHMRGNNRVVAALAAEVAADNRVAPGENGARQSQMRPDPHPDINKVIPTPPRGGPGGGGPPP